MEKFTKLTVNDLLSGKVPPEFNDKVFWFASRVQMSENILRIEIQNESGLTAFRPLCEQLDITCIDTLAELRPKVDWNNGFGPVLVSSGSFLFINNKLAVTRRDAKAKFDPNLWTTPAGRCDRTPLETALKETIEEIHIYDESGNWMIPESATYLITKGQKYKTYPARETDKNHSIKTVEVQCILDGKLIESSRMWSYYNLDVNTLELRLLLYAELQEPLVLGNEEFIAETRLVSLGGLNCNEAVCAIMQLKKQAHHV